MHEAKYKAIQELDKLRWRTAVIVDKTKKNGHGHNLSENKTLTFLDSF